MRGNELDLYLSMGYFRSQQDVFTCHFLVYENRICPVHWLRINVRKAGFGTKQRRLFRANERFSTATRPFRLNQELEALYARYREAIDFDAPESVESCLLGGVVYNAFDTQVLEVRDGQRLIAAGIFDYGSQTMAGIMNFYDPDYRKYSLGKYLMLLKISHAQQQRKAFYYPGYVVSNYPKFDYKLFACEPATEVFDESRNTWLPFSWELVNALATEMLE